MAYGIGESAVDGVGRPTDMRNDKSFFAPVLVNHIVHPPPEFAFSEQRPCDPPACVRVGTVLLDVHSDCYIRVPGCRSPSLFRFIAAAVAAVGARIGCNIIVKTVDAVVQQQFLIGCNAVVDEISPPGSGSRRRNRGGIHF